MKKLLIVVLLSTGYAGLLADHCEGYLGNMTKFGGDLQCKNCVFGPNCNKSKDNCSVNKYGDEIGRPCFYGGKWTVSSEKPCG